MLPATDPLMKLRPLILPLAALAFAPAVRGADAIAPADGCFFETRVRPLLTEKCLKCHGPQVQKGGLRLDSAEALGRRGASGRTLVVRDRPEESLLLRAVRHADVVKPMPPDARLTASEVADLASWVKSGAPFPAAAKTATADPAKHWAFRPVADPAAPAVKDSAWPKSDLDRFVLAKLEEAGLQPAPPADKRTLLRRATFDLTGLPPTPEEIDTFLKDESPDAFAKVVERLLASPAYGERWGRHWLDVARYADSNGLDENTAHGNAWRYRDYVIASFNKDKPYDRFLLEQVAGDLLRKDEGERMKDERRPPSGSGSSIRSPSSFDPLVATGFLALGPKVLAEPDEKKMELDIVDEQIDTLGRAVLGLTLGCARCHDHKFDPIPQQDYYALAGIFVSTRTMENFKKVARWYENSLATAEAIKRKADHDAAAAKLKERVKVLTARKDAKTELEKARAELAALEKSAPELPSAMGVTEGTPTDVPVLPRGNHLTPAEVVARRFPVVLAGKDQPALPKDHSGRLELARWLTDPKNPLTARVLVNRVWRWHFGTGLVRSVDNFGLLGEKPTHPELLDRLATDFVKDGWSLKKLHRRIMLTASYQMSSAHDPKAALADPDNRLLWRANVRRLEAEAVRDSLLAVGGLLDRAAGGPALAHVKNRDYLFDHTSKDQTNYASDRRSVYLPVIRNNLYDVFQLFDAPDPAVPNGDRASTTVPTQALFFMNSDLAARSADALAGRLLARPGLDDAGRVRLLFALAYGRPPSEEEVKRVTAGVVAFDAGFADEADSTKRRRKAWSAACQVVLAANEFIYVQ
jgi:hypothetical protein